SAWRHFGSCRRPRSRRGSMEYSSSTTGPRGRSPEIMREVGKLGGRPRSIKKVYPTLWALSERMFNDLEVQNRIFEAMRDGTMHPSEVRREQLGQMIRH